MLSSKLIEFIPCVFLGYTILKNYKSDQIIDRRFILSTFTNYGNCLNVGTFCVLIFQKLGEYLMANIIHDT